MCYTACCFSLQQKVNDHLIDDVGSFDLGCVATLRQYDNAAVWKTSGGANGFLGTDNAVVIAHDDKSWLADARKQIEDTVFHRPAQRSHHAATPFPAAELLQ